MIHTKISIQMQVPTSLVGFYFTLFLLICLVCYGGYESTLRLFTYIELQLRYAIVRIKIMILSARIRKQLIKDTDNYSKLIKELKNGR